MSAMPGVEAPIRKILQFDGLAYSNEYGVFNNNIVNLEKSVVERVFLEKGTLTPPWRPKYSKVDTSLKLFRKLLQHKVVSAPKLSYDEFLSRYSGRKRTLYANAIESLVSRPLSRKDGFWSGFLKFEKVKKSAVPRMINPRRPRYNVELGRYVFALEHKYYHAVERIFGEPTILKGYNMRERGRVIQNKWSKYDHPVAIGLDAIRLDQHISEAMLRYEHTFYTSKYPGDTLLCKLLSWQLHNVSYANAKDGKLHYEVDGVRGSGDVNTALGNCLLMTNMVWSYMRSVGIRRYSLINDGDDCVVILDQADYDKCVSGLEGWFRSLGCPITIEPPVYELEHIEFCQSHPVMIDDECVMIRNLKPTLSKDSMVILPIPNPSVMRRYLASVGMCGMSLCGGVPILQEFYNVMLRSSDGARPLLGDPTMDTGIWRLCHGMYRKYKEVSDETRYSFWKAFGVLPDTQRAMEDYYCSITIGGQTVAGRVPLLCPCF